MDPRQQQLFVDDLKKGRSILSDGGSDWEMLKSPEPILFVLAELAKSTSNRWVNGGDIVPALLPLKKTDVAIFNPDGWLGKEITEVRKGKTPLSEPLERWLPLIERSETKPYSYRLKQDLYEVVSQFDFESDFAQSSSLSRAAPERPSWLVAWNPNKWDWPELQAAVDKTSRGTPEEIRWSFANSRVQLGDEAWLVRLGKEPRVVFGHGRITRSLYDAEHWDPDRSAMKETTRFVDVSFDQLRDPDGPDAVSVAELSRRGDGDQRWTPQQSGIRINDRDAALLRALWNREELPPMATRERSAILSVADQIEAKHVRLALERIARDGYPGDAASTVYDLIEDATRYPPKYVLSLAVEFATGKPLDRASFSGGESSTSFRILRELGFQIEPKRLVQEMVAKFLAQSGTGNLAVSDYPESYRGLEIKVSFGKGNVARIPWIAFLADGEEVPNGIYPALLFYREQRVLLLCYGVSETTEAARKWAQTDRFQTVNEWFDSKFSRTPDRYGDSFVKASYAVDQSPDLEDLALQLDQMIAEYHKIVGGTTSRLPKARQEAIARPLEVRADLGEAVSAFSAALRNANVSFGDTHADLVRALLASVVTKPFLILTGLSGSGKTQVAIRLGEWLGPGHLHVAAVRPDWTGSEAVFGYEDGLRKSAGGRSAWSIPPVLEFMLRAARDRQHPYLLLLDEMNLAHVERYFADVLSGMESKQPCLPNVFKEEDGCWRIPALGESRLPLPSNLWIVGTVNVDETTYMFSPKVLDRANVFEFRVTTEDLKVGASKPSQCAFGDPALVRGLLGVSSDDTSDTATAEGPVSIVSTHLHQLHRLMSRYGMEFGYRTFYESRRFASLMQLAGANSVESILDRIVLQRLLPRLHGARRRLEIPLLALAHFARDLPEDSPPDAQFSSLTPETVPEDRVVKLPLSHEKIRRMLRSLRANQFASFTE